MLLRFCRLSIRCWGSWVVEDIITCNQLFEWSICTTHPNDKKMLTHGKIFMEWYKIKSVGKQLLFRGNSVCYSYSKYVNLKSIILQTKLRLSFDSIECIILTSHQSLVSINKFRVKIPFDFRNGSWIIIFTYICPIYVIRVRLCDRRMCWLESRTTPWCASIGKQKQFSLEVKNNLRNLKMT